MAHNHAHPHEHSHAPRGSHDRARLTWTLVLTLVYMMAEIIGGYLADSLALLADAGHMFSDAVALALGLFAAWLSSRPATRKHSYGYHRAEILAALANGATLIAISILIFIEAARRFRAPEPVAGPLMFSIAAGGLVANLIGLAILHGGSRGNLNVQGVWLHVLTDALGSVAALVAGGLIWKFGWNWVDPLASIAIGILVIYSSWSLVKQAIAILMESTPAHLDIGEIELSLAAAPGVRGVHDLHVWTITSGLDSLSAHVVIDDTADANTALADVRQLLHDRFGIDHVTIQIETTADHCTCAF